MSQYIILKKMFFKPFRNVKTISCEQYKNRWWEGFSLPAMVSLVLV